MESKAWFHSLTRRKKSSSPGLELQHNQSNSNNNNELPDAAAGEEIAINRKGKIMKSVIQRFGKKIGLRISLSRQSKSEDATTDASDEFLTHSPREAHMSFNFEREGASKLTHHLKPSCNKSVDSEQDIEMIPFTRDYHRFIVKKWLEGEAGPNRAMYKASCEMLGQVWYWGDISRKDAQKQLTDKPTGSFLVRDSETRGNQFTLSFRIVNVTLHYRLEYRDNYWYFEELQYESIVEMIEDILNRCSNDNFVCFVRVTNEMQPPFPVILKYPLSRYSQIPHLQDLCRRVLQRHLLDNEIQKLPIPTKLKEYLAEKRELVFQT